jgi:hypothetical protein
MMKYSPPPSTRLFVASSERASAVGIVTACPITISRRVPQKPRVPTANPNRRKRIAPRMVETAVKYTGAVPNRRFAEVVSIVILSGKKGKGYQIINMEKKA